MTEKDRIQIQILLERDMHNAIVKLANQAERSMAAQARWMLGQHIRELKRITNDISLRTD